LRNKENKEKTSQAGAPRISLNEKSPATEAES
jgi:hypothetical protein